MVPLRALVVAASIGLVLLSAVGSGESGSGRNDAQERSIDELLQKAQDAELDVVVRSKQISQTATHHPTRQVDQRPKTSSAHEDEGLDNPDIPNDDDNTRERGCTSCGG